MDPSARLAALEAVLTGVIRVLEGAETASHWNNDNDDDHRHHTFEGNAREHLKRLRERLTVLTTVDTATNPHVDHPPLLDERRAGWAP